MSLLSLITTVDNVPLDFVTNHDPYYTLLIAPDTRSHGFMHPKTLTNLPLPSEFTINHESKTVTLTATTAAAANAALQTAINTALSLPAHFPQLNSLHSEPFLIPGAQLDSNVHIERFTSSIFGIATRGAHMTAYVRGDDNSLKIWVARRNRTLHTYPGMLDSTVAGGVKATDSPWDCIIAESDEEARLPKSLTEKRVKPTGVVTLANKNRRNELFHGEILYVYDLELQPDEKPVPGDDDEVEEFVLMEWKEVVERMLASEFKPNVCPVMIDFLIRHGLITPDEKDYVEICTRLRRSLPMATSK